MTWVSSSVAAGDVAQSIPLTATPEETRSASTDGHDVFVGK